jgi:Lon protease-like protein
MVLAVTEAATETLAIFPLPTVVLFPRARVPLHIFEPRYREMTANALAGDRCLGMVAVRPEAIHQMAGNPPVFPIGCSGVIERVQRHRDGRYDLVLLGTHRFRIAEELETEPQSYRIARVERLEDRFDPTTEADSLQALRFEVIEVLKALLGAMSPGKAGLPEPQRFSGIDDLAFVNLMCQLLDVPPVEKQGLLEVDRVVDRCRRLLAVLRFRLAEIRSSGPSGLLH